MNSHCAPWLPSWQRAVAAAVQRGAVEGDVVVLPPASERDVRQVENGLGRKLPGELRALFIGHSRAVELKWQLPAAANPPAALREISSGTLQWNLDDLIEIDQSRREAAVSTWDHTLAFMVVGNGDLIAVETGGKEQPVVYLDHEEEIVWRLAPTLFTFLERWSTLGVPGPDIDSLKPFLGRDGLDPEGNTARQWRDWMGIDRACGDAFKPRAQFAEPSPEALAARLLRTIPIEPRREMEAWNLAKICLEQKLPTATLRLIDALSVASLKSEAIVLKIPALVQLGRLADAHTEAQRATAEWLAPANSQHAINQTVSKRQLLSVLSELPGGEELRAKVANAPEPDPFVPEGDFF